jgi:hypothetical protein
VVVLWWLCGDSVVVLWWFFRVYSSTCEPLCAFSACTANTSKARFHRSCATRGETARYSSDSSISPCRGPLCPQYHISRSESVLEYYHPASTGPLHGPNSRVLAREATHSKYQCVYSSPTTIVAVSYKITRHTLAPFHCFRTSSGVFVKLPCGELPRRTPQGHEVLHHGFQWILGMV